MNFRIPLLAANCPARLRRKNTVKWITDITKKQNKEIKTILEWVEKLKKNLDNL